MNNEVIDRVLAEVRDAEKNGVTAHSVYTSGLFEEGSPVLDRVLAEVRDAEKNGVTNHQTYTSGLFEDAE
jgi:hypothetical protein